MYLKIFSLLYLMDDISYKRTYFKWAFFLLFFLPVLGIQVRQLPEKHFVQQVAVVLISQCQSRMYT